VCLQLLDKVTLGLDSHMHLSDFVFLAAGVQIIVALVLSHVAASHASIFLHELVFELSEKLVVNVAESLN